MDNKELSFEEALARLESLVNKLEEGNLPLEESLELFAEGIKLTKQCNKQLEEAENQICILMEDKNDNPDIREEEL
jgi:exodeoxyribonuclease VII small subunit